VYVISSSIFVQLFKYSLLFSSTSFRLRSFSKFSPLHFICEAVLHISELIHIIRNRGTRHTVVVVHSNRPTIPFK